MKPLDYMTLFALFAGPALAVAVQLWFTDRSEKRRRKLAVLDILMQYRGRLIHSDSVRALNNIDVVFYDSPAVRKKFMALLDFLDTDEMKLVPLPPRTSGRLDDLLTELLSEMCKVLSFDFDHTQIKTKAYRPSAFANEDKYVEDFRAAMIPLLAGKSALLVKAETFAQPSDNNSSK
jgi:hypothetical protein